MSHKPSTSDNSTGAISAPRQQQREVWIDCLRGFTMLLVVLSHVESSLGIETVFSHWCTAFRMPLFFFITGYFAWSSRPLRGLSGMKNVIVRRFVMVVWPTLIFFPIYCALYIYHNHTVKEILMSNTMIGYWFTVAAFEMLALCLPLIKLLHQDMRSRVIATVLLLVAIPIAGLLGDYITHSHLIVHKVVLLLLIRKVLYFLPCFIAGVLLHCWQERLSAILKQKAVLAVVAVALFIGLNMTEIDNEAIVTPLCMLLAVCIFYAAEALKRTLNSQARFVRIISYVGRSTLPVYLIYLFFTFIFRSEAVQAALPDMSVTPDRWLPLLIALSGVIIAASLGVYELMGRLGIRKYIFPRPPRHHAAYNPQQNEVKIIQA